MIFFTTEPQQIAPSSSDRTHGGIGGPVRVYMQLTEHDSSPSEVTVSQNRREVFEKDGFLVIPDVFDRYTVDAPNDRLEKSELLSGSNEYGLKECKTWRLKSHSGKSPSSARDTVESDENGKNTTRTRKKSSCRVGPLGFSGNLNNSTQLLERRQVVAELAGRQQGARLAQDQVWAKPPGGSPLVFHQDNPYFMFIPSDVLTVWVALDDMIEELGLLNGGHTSLRLAADGAGVDQFETVSVAGLAAGGISIHDGRTWHGSEKNMSRSRPRRGLGLHFVPAEITFTKDAENSRLWKSNVENEGELSQLELPEQTFHSCRSHQDESTESTR